MDNETSAGAVHQRLMRGGLLLFVGVNFLRSSLPRARRSAELCHERHRGGVSCRFGYAALASRAGVRCQSNAQLESREVLARLKADLQTAIEIELATIPIYLYTYYSLDPKHESGEGHRSPRALSRTRRAAITMSVAVEEMLHMSLSSQRPVRAGRRAAAYRRLRGRIRPRYLSQAGGPKGRTGRPRC